MVLGLLLSGNAYADEPRVWFKNENNEETDHFVVYDRIKKPYPELDEHDQENIRFQNSAVNRSRQKSPPTRCRNRQTGNSFVRR